MPEARRRGLPAQAHVVALVVTLFLPLALAAAALLWHAAEAERDRSRQDALGLARRLAADVDRELDGVVLTLQALATSPALQAGDLATFAAQARAVPGFRGGEIVLSDRAGRPLVSAGAPEAPLPASAPAELGEAAAAVFASGAPLVSDLPAEVAGGRFLLLVEVPARRDGAVAFALGVILPPARLSEALAADLPSPAWTAAVVDRQGRIVVRSREAGRPAAGLAPEDARRDATEPEGLGTGATPDGTPVLVAYARPRLAPWRVEDEVPAALVEAPLRRLWWLLAGMAPVLGLATAAAGWWGGRLSREVRRLAAAAAAIERGEPVRPVASPVREINGIGEALAVAAAERATAEAALRESERRFRDFAEAGSDWFWETDAEHRFVWQSANVGRTSGVPAEWAYGKTRLEIAAPDTDPTTLEAHRRTLEAHRPFRDFEYLRRGPLGDLWLSTSGVPVLDEAGRLAGYRGIGRDITATKRAEEQVQRLAHHDPLTGLPNRVLFRDRFGQALALAGRGGGRLAVLLLDLDDFKGVNDTLGHPTGDALLRGIAGRLGGLVRGGDTLARLGGDEFALVQVGARQPADAAALAARLLAALEAPFDLDGRAVHVAASLGIALYPEDGADPDELLKNADLALYRAKAEDRGRFRFFEPAMEAAVRARRELEAELRHGLERGEFTLVYQPQLDLRTGAITGVEALLRWRHPTRGLVPPGEFVPAAEASGLIVPLGAWVLREACRQAAAWRRQGLALTVAVNVSPVQLRHPDLLDVVDEALAASGLEPGRLELEITEGILVVPEGGMAERIAGLGERGVRLAIDDFGTGYSSLAYLRRLPARRIKVDRSFVGTISTDPEGEAVVRAIVSLGHALGKEVVAEGVETEAQLAFLRELGCDAAQGFLLARPRPAAEVERLLAA